MVLILQLALVDVLGHARQLVVAEGVVMPVVEVVVGVHLTPAYQVALWVFPEAGVQAGFDTLVDGR
ncbi:hypothetical protein D3C85_1794850 [compost metagenome]